MTHSAKLIWILNKILPFDADIIECTDSTVHISIQHKIYTLPIAPGSPMQQAKDIKKQLQEKYPELIL